MNKIYNCDEEVIIKSNRFKVVCIFMFFTVIELVMLSNIIYFNIESIVIKFIIMIASLFIAFGMIVYFIQIFENKPLLIINKNGFTDNSTLLSLGFISWEEVIELYEKSDYINELKNIHFIAVRLKDINKLLNTVSKIKSKLIRSNLDTILISVVTSTYKDQEVLEIMQYYFDSYKEKQMIN
ncbi:STM3941 family protein [Haloplasma contractile]|uniref:Uncharacterized protein n=1 Tax=Haloplasma contractile SSD-17B TaxID=1033810 RepID=U2E7G2_9MOLU|nr:STM3941 family protein [Haloplasma contractile]ERJ11143.1 hypothetical protein HLPCO_002808 [Haloplasma contractile SSD-17B]